MSEALGKSGHHAVRLLATERCGELARDLLGPPTTTNRREMRWAATYDLVLTVTGVKQGLWYDFNRGVGGDMVELFRYIRGGSRADAIAWIGAKLVFPTASFANRPDSCLDDRSLAERKASALRAYARGRAAYGTLAERYFQHRGLDVPEPLWRQLRFDPACRLKEGIFPAILMPLRNWLSLEIVGVHKIALNSDGTNARRADGRKLKKSAGQVKGAAMMLGQPVESLAICEGLETALGMQMSGRWPECPVWALAGAAFLAALPPVGGVRRLVIGADNDVSGVGLRAAREAANRWVKAGFEVEIAWPASSDTDFADVYRHGELA